MKGVSFHHAKKSSTVEIPENRAIPQHVAIIMDGNGRWARRRMLPRVAGHKQGVESVRRISRACILRGIEYLTLFAFSSENWRRPAEEVGVLKQLFLTALDQEISRIDRAGVRLKLIGDLTPFGNDVVVRAREAEERTSLHTKLTLTIAANYGGRWDLMQAINRLAADLKFATPDSHAKEITEGDIANRLALSYAPEPDLFIRTGGEQRISNFLLWQLAYTELYFTPTLWPDFDSVALDEAIVWFRTRERRFGRTSEQLLMQNPERLEG